MADGRERTATEIAARRIDGTRGDALRRMLHDKLDGWRGRDLIHSWSVLNIDNDGPLRSCLELRLPFSGELISHTITSDELEMGGTEALRFWLDTIGRSLYQHRDHWRLSRPVASPSPVYTMRTEAMTHEAAALRFDAEYRNRLLNQYADFIAMYANGAAFGIGLWDAPRYDEEADTKAKELFVSVAGQDAYQTLEAGKPLPIKGSEGTDYRLFRRATYCVERPSDGARLCAVVPGVPMYDHLLGIKLMVEHDEPAFLRAANVSGGERRFYYSRPMRADSFNPDMYGYGP